MAALGDSRFPECTCDFLAVLIPMQEEPEVVYEDNEVEDRSTSGSETDVECPKV